jgi:hypothetical protein
LRGLWLRKRDYPAFLPRKHRALALLYPLHEPITSNWLASRTDRWRTFFVTAVDRLLLVNYVNRRGRLLASLKRRVVHDARMIGLVILVVMRIVKLGVVVGVRRYRPLIIILAAFGVLH